MDLFSQAQRSGNPDRIRRRSGSPPRDRRGRAEDHHRCPAAARRTGCSTQAVVIRSGRPSRTGLTAGRQVPGALDDHAVTGDRGEGETDRSHRSHWPDGSARSGALPAPAHRCARGSAEDVPLIVAPPRRSAAISIACWLLAVQLYGVRSARNWGMGDFTDLEGPDRTRRRLWAPTASASIRCMRCSTTGRPIAARIRRTAGCS